VGHDQIQIMSVPRRDPKVGQIPNFLSCHFRFSNRRFVI
jgi:hypothetical protein